ncbi:MAG: hypothetical protein ILA34_03255 [Bacteroidaceae bacterium]|nr:hypothetical protein [Bacteroidaceae bacterium]
MQDKLRGTSFFVSFSFSDIPPCNFEKLGEFFEKVPEFFKKCAEFFSHTSGKGAGKWLRCVRFSEKRWKMQGLFSLSFVFLYF